jgi:hypothetical protein
MPVIWYNYVFLYMKYRKKNYIYVLLHLSSDYSEAEKIFRESHQ